MIMKRVSHLLTLLAVLLFSLFGLNCNGDNPAINLDDPSTLVGSYDLVSALDKIGDIGPPGTTYQAGEATQIVEQGVTVTVTLTGTLVLTETRFTFMFTGIFSAPGVPTQTENDNSTGTYSINGTTITTVDDSDGTTDSSTISASGNRVTIDDSDITLVFEKR